MPDKQTLDPVAIGIPEKGRTLLLVADEQRGAALARALGGDAVWLPAWDASPLDDRDPSRLTQGARLAALRRIDSGRARIVVCSPSSAAMALPGPALGERGRTLDVGVAVEPDQLRSDLVALGYDETSRADRPGLFAIHGATIDVWPIADARPVRVRMENRSVTSLDRYDPSTMRTCEPAGATVEATLACANPVDDAAGSPRDWPLEHGRRTLTEWLKSGAVLAEPEAVERGLGLIAEWDAEREEMREDGERLPPVSGRLSVDEWNALVAGAKALDVDVFPESAGGATPDVIADEILGAGDHVVHLHHGLGLYRGMERVSIAGEETDCFQIEFGDGGLKVSASEADLVWRYGDGDGDGAEGRSLDRMGGTAWAERVAVLAGEMTDTAAKLREALAARADRTAPVIDWESEGMTRLASDWHRLTPDQDTACRAIADDLTGEGGHTRKLRGRMVRPPMDRLVCGDVGFGKTEIILRAAAATAFAGFQAVFAAPTVLLARQHERTLRERLTPLGLAVHALTGGDAKARQAACDALEAGEPCIVVGTHALASDDVRLEHAALLVLDEEQRFGAEVKLELRRKAADAHVLATTATPIPRTTMAAMVGLRAVSTLRTPLPGRQAIRTDVVDWSPRKLRRAILSEHASGGRTLVIVPRIADHEKVVAGLRDLVPGLTIDAVTGKVDDEEADRRLRRVADGGTDVLVATTIIETGIDLPMANLIVMLDASRLGLGQLHQLRGRVGRGIRRGRAMLFDACDWIDAGGGSAVRQRLRVLERHDELGSGFAIATRDLEQRGSGDLFGEEQTGHTQHLGVELYSVLLSRALRGVGTTAMFDAPRVTLPRAGIPVAYVPYAETRARLYSRIAKADTLPEIEEIAAELIDRFGPIPDEAAALLRSARLRVRLCAHGAREVKAGPKGIALTFAPTAAATHREHVGKAGKWKGDKLVLPHDGDAEEALSAMLERLDGSALERAA